MTEVQNQKDTGRKRNLGQSHGTEKTQAKKGGKRFIGKEGIGYDQDKEVDASLKRAEQALHKSED
jgi:hypothetical protein